MNEDKDFKFTVHQLDMILNIMRDFDFEKAHQVMEYLNWEWAFAENGVPSINEIKVFAESLLKDSIRKGVKEGRSMTMSSGGFEARYTFGEEEGLRLLFVVEEYTAW